MKKLVGLLIFFGLFIPGCQPVPFPLNFVVEPDFVCPGDTVHIEWTSGGDITNLNAAPEPIGYQDRFGHVENEGSADVPINETTTFTIDTSTADAERTGSHTVTVVGADGMTVHMSVSPTCVGVGQVEYSSIQPIETYGGSLVISRIINTSGSVVQVEHGGASIILNPGDTFDTTEPQNRNFQNIPYAGDYNFIVGFTCIGEICPAGIEEGAVRPTEVIECKLPTITLDVLLSCGQ